MSSYGSNRTRSSHGVNYLGGVLRTTHCTTNKPYATFGTKPCHDVFFCTFSHVSASGTERAPDTKRISTLLQCDKIERGGGSQKNPKNSTSGSLPWSQPQPQSFKVAGPLHSVEAVYSARGCRMYLGSWDGDDRCLLLPAFGRVSNTTLCEQIRRKR